MPVSATWTEVPIVRADGSVTGQVVACLIGTKERAHGGDGPPFTLAGEVFERGGHKDLIRIFVPFGTDESGRATGALEGGYHRSFERRPGWGQVEALLAPPPHIPAPLSTPRLH